MKLFSNLYFIELHRSTTNAIAYSCHYGWRHRDVERSPGKY